eukprot:746677-Hanusia_phi.AAC.5
MHKCSEVRCIIKSPSLFCPLQFEAPCKQAPQYVAGVWKGFYASYQLILHTRSYIERNDHWQDNFNYYQYVLSNVLLNQTRDEEEEG